MLYYNRIYLSDEINVAKSNNSRECIICHCWCFNHVFKFKDSVCNGCHDLVICHNISDITIVNVKGVDYGFIILDINKCEPVHLLDNSVVDGHEYV